MDGHGFGYGDEMSGWVGDFLLRRRKQSDSRLGGGGGLAISSIGVIFDFRFSCCYYYCRCCYCYWQSFRSRTQARDPMYRQTTSGATVVVPRVRRCVFDFDFGFETDYGLMGALLRSGDGGGC